MEKTDADELSLLTKYLLISPTTFREFFEILPSSGYKNLNRQLVIKQQKDI